MPPCHPPQSSVLSPAPATRARRTHQQIASPAPISGENRGTHFDAAWGALCARAWFPSFRYPRLLIGLALGFTFFATLYAAKHRRGDRFHDRVHHDTPPTSAAPGATGTVDITVTRSAGYTAGVTISFDQGQSVTGSIDVPSGQSVGHLPYTVASSAVVGSSAWTLTATADNSGGSETSSLEWDTTVLLAGSFVLQHGGNANGSTIVPGASVQDTLTIVRQGFPQSIAFTGPGQPVSRSPSHRRPPPVIR